MPMKEWFRQLQPVQLYFMLAITALFFITQMVMSHMTHALTLLVDSYHMLCNLIALTGCIITIKYGSASVENEEEPGSPPSAPPCHTHEAAGCSNHHNHHHHHHHNTGSSSERRLKNTFGWARIDVVVMLIGCVFLNSLCFSLIVEALQTLIHIDHHDEMHHPIPVLVVGAVGLLINGMCYLLIGGYTFHQASFLHVTASGEVVLDHIVTQDSVRKGQRRLSAQSRRIPPLPQYTQRQGPWEMCRDIIGCMFVIICALVVYFTDQKIAKLVDPLLSIVSALSLLILSYPYMRESGFILLQTIPDTINIDSLRKELLKAFPDILNVHDLHVWRLTASKVFSTAHIIFLNAKDYTRITKEVSDFFHDQGITQVTIQPEFFKADNKSSITVLQDNECLVPCRGEGCHSLHCCGYNKTTLMTVSVTPNNSNNRSSHQNGNSCKANVPTQGSTEIKTQTDTAEATSKDKTIQISEVTPVENATTETAEAEVTTSDEQDTSSVTPSTDTVPIKLSVANSNEETQNEKQEPEKNNTIENISDPSSAEEEVKKTEESQSQPDPQQIKQDTSSITK